MRYFRRILTGVDLTGGGRTLSTILNPASEAAVERSLLLAGKTGAEICFATVLEADVTTGRLIHDAREDGCRLQCSLLAVRPDGFECPVDVE